LTWINLSNFDARRIFVSAGEVSGDETLGAILEELRSLQPNLILRGLGGPAAIKQGLNPMFSMEKTGVSGIWDVLRNAVFLIGMYRRARHELVQFQPHLVLLVDYPGLNLRLARKARSMGLEVLYVAPPQLWVYKNPIRRMARTLRSLKGCSVHVLFAFEAKTFMAAGGPVTVGSFKSMKPDGTHGKISTEKSQPVRKKILGLFPGSRLPVIRRNLAVWLEHLESHFQSEESSSIIATSIPVLVPDFLQAKVQSWLMEYQKGKFQKFIALTTDKEAVFAASDYALAYPGTITLELLLQRIPTLVLAVMDPFSLAIGRRILNSRHLGLPNLLLKDTVFPEWAGTGSKLTKSIFSDLMKSLQSQQPDWTKLKACMDQQLGPKSGAKIASQEAFRLLNLEEIPQKGVISR
jgi:lipid-A-disaccharide synthase